MLKIILIDDEPLILKYLTLLLSKRYKVIPFDSPIKAKQFLSRNSDIDYIISDYMMNELNGIELFDYIVEKNYFDMPEKYFLFMTAFDNNSIYNKLIKTGCRVVSKAELNIDILEVHFE